MPTSTTYKGMTIESGTPSKAAGQALNDNFSALADAMLPVAFDSPLPHPSNPLLSTSGEAFVSVFRVGSTWHAYGGASTISHWTSSDGITWGTPTVISGLSDAGVASAWYESGTYYMLYRMSGGAGIGLATSSDGSSWTPDAGNPVLSGTAGQWDDDTLDPWGLIKIGSTYYLWYNTVVASPRGIGLATSTDLTTWTKDGNNPIFTDGRFCACIFKLGIWYYLLLPHYTSGSNLSELELYCDTSPTFYSASRQFLGVVKPAAASGWDSNDQDTPWVVTDDVSRNSYNTTNGQWWCYYAGESGGAWKTGLLVQAASGAIWQHDQNGGGYDLVNVHYVGLNSTSPRTPVWIDQAAVGNAGMIGLKDPANSGDTAVAYQSFWDSTENGSGTTGRLGYIGYAGGSLADLWLVNDVADRDINFRINNGGTNRTVKFDGSANQFVFDVTSLSTTAGIGIGSTVLDELLHIRPDSGTGKALIQTHSAVANDYAGLMFRVSTYEGTAEYEKGAVIFERLGGGGVGRIHLCCETTSGVGNATPSDSVFSADYQGVCQVNSILKFLERTSDPAAPAEGEAIIWLSNGTSSQTGVADGDLVVASTAGGATRVTIVHDHSAGAAWV